ncbi:hypothetical protein AGDE_14678 [Angomonas deanei]|uniref:PSP1 C-terminal conserved region containing protein, putative n=1 Tax=Angomonas deanei TaxID=59799 RepID=A0A7G2CD48_9TRYP|nr:hypothetical protein AGDE_14678 [Angomonas deanei]CAD2217750.1 PSP1 C-terminal conserved region containing protein, putative [Angomonas deanei]|eukprot:EPY20429.1 hypothetical protein AGDE_14678 [Angomonas deanei]
MEDRRCNNPYGAALLETEGKSGRPDMKGNLTNNPEDTTKITSLFTTFGADEDANYVSNGSLFDNNRSSSQIMARSGSQLIHNPYSLSQEANMLISSSNNHSTTGRRMSTSNSNLKFNFNTDPLGASADKSIIVTTDVHSNETITVSVKQKVRTNSLNVSTASIHGNNSTSQGVARKGDFVGIPPALSHPHSGNTAGNDVQQLPAVHGYAARPNDRNQNNPNNNNNHHANSHNILNRAPNNAGPNYFDPRMPMDYRNNMYWQGQPTAGYGYPQQQQQQYVPYMQQVVPPTMMNPYYFQQQQQQQQQWHNLNNNNNNKGGNVGPHPQNQQRQNTRQETASAAPSTDRKDNGANNKNKSKPTNGREAHDGARETSSSAAGEQPAGLRADHTMPIKHFVIVKGKHEGHRYASALDESETPIGSVVLVEGDRGEGVGTVTGFIPVTQMIKDCILLQRFKEITSSKETMESLKEDLGHQTGENLTHRYVKTAADVLRDKEEEAEKAVAADEEGRREQLQSIVLRVKEWPWVIRQADDGEKQRLKEQREEEKETLTSALEIFSKFLEGNCRSLLNDAAEHNDDDKEKSPAENVQVRIRRSEELAKVELVDCEYQMNKTKLTLYVTRPSRDVFVDFRRMQRKLHRAFRCRIWLAYMDEVSEDNDAPFNQVMVISRPQTEQS